jgi:basic amino acid/polyamine antiporter, APA family
MTAMEQSALPGGGRDLFVRNSTGLVRDLSAFDAFNLVFSAVLIPVGITQVMGFTPQFWPHANMLVSFLVATPLVLCFGLVYLYFTLLMPRSGGDYVWLSRTVHPMVGFVANVSVTFVFMTWISFNFTFMLRTMGPAAAYVLGSHSQWLTAPSNNQVMLIATVLTAAFAGLMLLGTRVIARYMTLTFVVVWAGMLVWLIGMAVTSRSDFTSRWNAVSGSTVDKIVATAHAGSFNAGGGLAWGATLFAMVYCFQVYTGFQWTGYFAGEIRNARRTAISSIIGGLIASAAIYMIAVALIYHSFGFSFFGSLVYLGLGGGTADYHLSFTPYLPAMVNFLNLPSVLRDFVAISFVLAILWWTPTGFMLGTRNLFAWSFDRLMPSKVTDVSGTTHTPVVAIGVIALFVELLNYLNVYQNLGAYLLNLIAVLGLAFVIVSLAAAALPWTRPNLVAAGPALGARRVAGVPLISVVGVISAVSWAFVVWTAFHTGFGGTLSWKPMIQAFVPTIIAIVWYLALTAYRRSQGISLTRTFQEIPPE